MLYFVNSVWFLGAVFSLTHAGKSEARVRENGEDYKSQALTCFDLAGGWGMFGG